ncbi:gluconokinase [Pseudoclavibacter sp. VKM Ac-2867]|uniref:gluconokinase n=1 Tax=Pseudoclavibacter sp. VKM Ac-2867 TaxID=2783829 RepID=UPI00188BE736|nr:FGGY-family carbohydrate kinase [Pseudoclavibacter sp. VKM Ac-2867]MBF4457685.1 FGGY-family carbohydrate kinase [Pseudoclavibacter sp. VKM Ac-2867]
MKILALESSTTSAKTLIFDSDTQEVQVRTRRFEVAGPDPAVRDAEGIFTQLIALARESVRGHDIDALVLSNTYHGLGLVTQDLQAASPVYEWPFTGAQGLCAELREDAELTTWFYERTGCMVNASYPAFKLAYLARQGVEIAGRKVMDQGSFNFLRFTGLPWTSYSLASGTGLLNVHTSDWDLEILETLGVAGVDFPELHDSEESAPLLADVATYLGIRPEIPVLVPGPDGGLSQVGDLAGLPGDMTFSMGTSGAMRFATLEPSLSPRLSTWAYRSPLGWLSGAATSGCTNCVDWAKDRFFGSDAQFSEIEPQLVQGRNELPTFLPFLYGERCPGWQDQRLGGFVGLEPRHGRVDMYQAVLQGVVLSLYHCFRELTAINGMPTRVLLSGGVLSSPFWTQMTADAFGVEMEVSSLQHSSVVGAVRLGLRAAGLSEDQPAFRNTETQRVIPNPAMRDYYDRAFAKYLDAYDRTSTAPDARAESLTGGNA